MPEVYGSNKNKGPLQRMSEIGGNKFLFFKKLSSIFSLMPFLAQYRVPEISVLKSPRKITVPRAEYSS